MRAKRLLKREGKMQEFIEVTREEDGKKLLINISKIETIYPEEENAAAFISISN